MISVLLFVLMFQSPIQKIESQNVRLYYSGATARQNAKGWLNFIQGVFKTDVKQIKYGQDRKINVRLCRDYLEFTRVSGLDSVFAPAQVNGILYVVCPDSSADGSYIEKLSRGVLLQLLTPLHSNGMPWWLIYSVAVYESGELQSLSPVPFISVHYLNDLEERIQNTSSGSNYEETLYYLGITGEFLEVKFGAGSLVGLLHEFTRANTFDSAIRRVLHVDKHRLEDEWRDYLKKEIRMLRY
ncbi:MAG: hypothetical protein ACP5US_08115 [Candidatus Kryptoniota bacterium]